MHSFSVDSLYQKIDTERLECLNESEEGAGKTVFKAWEDRLDKVKVCFYGCSLSKVNSKQTFKAHCLYIC